MVKSRNVIAWSALVLLCLLPACLLAAADVAMDEDASPGPFRLAVFETTSHASLDDIVNARVRVGFSPMAEQGIHFVGKPGRALWLRLQSDPPTDGSARFVSIPRQAITRLRLYDNRAGHAVLAETGIRDPGRQSRWPDAFVLPLPAGTSTVYLEVRGSGHLNITPTLVTREEMNASAEASSRFHGSLYGLLLVIGLLAVLRRSATGERSVAVASAALACLLASVIGNYHLQMTIGGVSLTDIQAVPAALWVMTCAPLIWATRQYSGHARNLPALAVALDRLGFVFLAIGMLLLLVPDSLIAPFQVVAIGMLAATAIIGAVALAFDPRQWRWTPILIWLALVPALLAIVLSMAQLIPPTTLVRHGFQVLLAFQLAVFVLLPWLRQSLQRRALKRRSKAVEHSAEEKIAQAREWVISSLQSSLDSAAEGDVEWIAYRRLLGGLKPVLAQSASAVVARNFHNEDLLLVEPKSAEPRFLALLAQRGALLKNLSRSLAPQQIDIDFDGPNGPLLQVPLAIIPLPIDRPGWGALVIERLPGVTYNEQELDLCTEFAALATTAGDEASEMMQRRHAEELDPESGVFRASMTEVQLAKAHELAIRKRSTFSILRVGIDGFEDAPANHRPARLAATLHAIRNETLHGDYLVRQRDDEFLVILAGRQLGEARLLAERFAMRLRDNSPGPADGGTVSVSVGATQLQPGERNAEPMMDRAGKALTKARQYGGNQVQAVSSTLA